MQALASTKQKLTRLTTWLHTFIYSKGRRLYIANITVSTRIANMFLRGDFYKLHDIVCEQKQEKVYSMSLYVNQ